MAAASLGVLPARPHPQPLAPVQVNKHKLVEDLGVPYRDLRMLDPLVCPCLP